MTTIAFSKFRFKEFDHKSRPKDMIDFYKSYGGKHILMLMSHHKWPIKDVAYSPILDKDDSYELFFTKKNAILISYNEQKERFGVQLIERAPDNTFFEYEVNQ